ncbi:hypothetical protein [Luteolibacter sp. AS25]|uniref:hypothetical protein n=1 Tax=Luteolibacter sp. AS25 TaxID=3135776 RepID=UPI00398A88DE
MTAKALTPMPSSVGPVVSNVGENSFRQGGLPPLGSAPAAKEGRWFPPLVVIPSVPKAPERISEEFSKAMKAPIAALPSPVEKAPPTTPALKPEIFIPSESEIPPSPQVVGNPNEARISAGHAESRDLFEAAPDFNDEDLAAAFAPMMEAVVRKVVVESDKGKIDALLEPMLRATIRRALAEYSPGARPFQQPGFIDRVVWRLQALFSSRTFEDVIFEKTHRFQVEEVYLLDVRTLALVSFASCDPARHSAAKRVEASAKRIALQIRSESGEIQRSIERADGKNVIAEKGTDMILVAIVRGSPSELILADLEFSLRRIEEHFSARFQQAGSALMHALQPFLEDCLLIQAPASAA